MNHKYNIYFVQGSSNRLHSAYFAHLSVIDKSKLPGLAPVPIFILSGCALMDHSPRKTQAKQLSEELILMDTRGYVTEKGLVIQHEAGIERLGCFLEARKGLETLVNEKFADLTSKNIFMPIESLYAPSYIDLFQKVTGFEVKQLPVLKQPINHPSFKEEAIESIITSHIAKDEKKRDLQTPQDWENYITEIYDDSIESTSKYKNRVWKGYNILKKIGLA